MSRHERVLVDGPDGKIEVFVENHENPQGIALIAHPHPLFGGTADNKVVTTLSRAFRERGCITLRPSFRGVGGSEGEHDHGDAETDDVLAVHDWARGRYADVLTQAGARLPLYLAGFSFGAYVTTRLAQRLAAAGDPAEMAGTGRHGSGRRRGHAPATTPRMCRPTPWSSTARTTKPCAWPTSWPGHEPHGPAGRRRARRRPLLPPPPAPDARHHPARLGRRASVSAAGPSQGGTAATTEPRQRRTGITPFLGEGVGGKVVP